MLSQRNLLWRTAVLGPSGGPNGFRQRAQPALDFRAVSGALPHEARQRRDRSQPAIAGPTAHSAIVELERKRHDGDRSGVSQLKRLKTSARNISSLRKQLGTEKKRNSLNPQSYFSAQKEGRLSVGVRSEWCVFF
jgi:hypothetical protein